MPYSEQQVLTQLESVFGGLACIAAGRGSGAQGQTISVVLDQPIGGVRSVSAECFTPCPPPNVLVVKTNSGQWYAIGSNIGTSTNTQVSQNRRTAPLVVSSELSLWQLYAIENSDAEPDPGSPPAPDVLFRQEFDSEICYIKQVGVSEAPQGLYHLFNYSYLGFGSATSFDVDPWELPDDFYSFNKMTWMYRNVFDGSSTYIQDYPASGNLIEYAYHPETYYFNAIDNSSWAFKVSSGGYFHWIQSVVGVGVYTAYLRDGSTFTFTLPPPPADPPSGFPPPPEPEPTPPAPPPCFKFQYFLKFQKQPTTLFAKIETAAPSSSAIVTILPLSLIPLSGSKCLAQILVDVRIAGEVVARVIHTIVHSGRGIILKCEEDVPTDGKPRNYHPRLQPYLDYLAVDLNLPNLAIPVYANLTVQIEFGSGNPTIFAYKDKPLEAVLKSDAPPPEPPPVTVPPTVRSTIVPAGKDWFAQSLYFPTVDGKKRSNSIRVALSAKDLDAMGLSFDTPIFNTSYTLSDVAANASGAGEQFIYDLSDSSLFRLILLRCLLTV